jgi:hypothetical protein
MSVWLWLQVALNFGFCVTNVFVWRWQVNAQKRLARHQVLLEAIMVVEPELRQKVDRCLDSWMMQP